MSNRCGGSLVDTTTVTELEEATPRQEVHLADGGGRGCLVLQQMFAAQEKLTVLSSVDIIREDGATVHVGSQDGWCRTHAG